MKTIATLLLCLFATAPIWAAATADLDTVMPLLQAKTRTTAQTQQVLNTFVSSKDPTTVFAAGASLVRLPPQRAQEAKLLNVLMKDNDELKKLFAAVILTAMGTEHRELLPLLQQATASADPALRSYAASAYTILEPQNTTYAELIINLYIYDASFAQRAMNLISSGDKQTLAFLKTACASPDAQIRAAAAAWLGDLQTQQAAKQLLKMAKSEKDSHVISALATALAKNRTWTLQDVVKGLKTSYKSPMANTYALALGFMPGYAIEPLKQALSDSNTQVRINAARAAAYMAGVLASADAAAYSSDVAFDISLLKGLIAQLTTLARSANPAEQEYAQTALTQISKLK